MICQANTTRPPWEYTEAEHRARQAKARRRYMHNHVKWLAEHPGEAIGRVLDHGRPVVYYARPGPKGAIYGWQRASQPLHPTATEITVDEYFEREGIERPTPADTMPVWRPESWVLETPQKRKSKAKDWASLAQRYAEVYHELKSVGVQPLPFAEWVKRVESKKKG